MWVTTFIHRSCMTLSYSGWVYSLTAPRPACGGNHTRANLCFITAKHGRGGGRFTSNLWHSFWEALPFLEENSDLALVTNQKLLTILQDIQKSLNLQLELAAVIDTGKAFMKVTHLLEGDGALYHVRVELSNHDMLITDELRTLPTPNCSPRFGNYARSW